MQMHRIGRREEDRGAGDHFDRILGPALDPERLACLDMGIGPRWVEASRVEKSCGARLALVPEDAACRGTASGWGQVSSPRRAWGVTYMVVGESGQLRGGVSKSMGTHGTSKLSEGLLAIRGLEIWEGSGVRRNSPTQ